MGFDHLLRCPLIAADQTVEIQLTGQVVALVLQTPSQVALALDRHRIAFPNVYYTGNADDLGDRLRFSGEIPVTIVFDRKGKELWRHEGRLDREKTIARLRETLRRMP